MYNDHPMSNDHYLFELVKNNNIAGLRNIDFLSFRTFHHGDKTQDAALCYLPYVDIALNATNVINSATVETLVDIGADINFDCMPNLAITHYYEHISHRIVTTSQLNVVKTLAELGTNFAIQDAYGQNACDIVYGLKMINDAHSSSRYSEVYDFLTENGHCEMTGDFFIDSDSEL